MNASIFAWVTGVGTAICGVATYKALEVLNRKAEQKENEK